MTSHIFESSQEYVVDVVSKKANCYFSKRFQILKVNRQNFNVRKLSDILSERFSFPIVKKCRQIGMRNWNANNLKISSVK